MDLIGSLQGGITLVLGVAALGLEIFALVDALRHPGNAYVAAGKRTKGFWLAVVGVCTAIGFITVFSPLNLFGLLAVIGAGVYLADVRPALQQVRGRGGRGSHQGPYGPW